MSEARANRRRRYAKTYRRSLEDPDGFRREDARRIDWTLPFGKVKDTCFNEADFCVSWFEDGTLKLAVGCLDRHLAERG